MGFEINSIKLLIKAKKELGVDFTDTVTIGRQGLHIKQDELNRVLINAGYRGIEVADLYKDDGFAERLLNIFGAKNVDSVDVSTYEKATIIHDMNVQVEKNLMNRFSVVIDGGSLEHVFNFPQAIKNCMQMVKPGGFFIGITPANNFFGHGFYQFSPELYYRIMEKRNGFKMTKLYFFTEGKSSKLYEVIDPLDAGDRVSIVNSTPSYLFVVAQKIEIRDVFAEVPLQSDYVNNSWKGQANVPIQINREFSFIKLLKSLIPVNFKTFLALNYRPTGISNQSYFREIEF